MHKLGGYLLTEYIKIVLGRLLKGRFMVRNKDNQFKTKIVFSIIFLFFILLIMGCASQQPIAKQVNICPTSSNETLDSKGDKPKLILILVKEHPNYLNYASQSFDILTRILPKVVEPNDRVIMMSMEEFDVGSAVFFDKKIDSIEKPSISNSPIPPPTIGSSQTAEDTPETVFGQAAAAQQIQADFKNTEVAATKAAFRYECDKQAWATSNDAAWQKWNSDKKKAISSFMTEFGKEMKLNKTNNFQISKNQIFEAMQSASLILNGECSKYARCDLVIFSDFEDVRNYHPPEKKFSLPTVKVAGMLLDCRFEYKCGKKIDFWSETFAIYGASSSQFAFGDDVEKILISYFLRR
jgi:hypothetical protein